MPIIDKPAIIVNDKGVAEKHGACSFEAKRLMSENGSRGGVYYVSWTPKGIAGHAYYVPDESDLDAIGLNHADNGYGRYPELTVRDILDHGMRMP